MSITKRRRIYHLDTVFGNRRVRCSLGVRDPKAAERLANRITFAMADGPKSPVWGELRKTLPASSFKRIANGLLPDDPLNLTELEQKFYDHTERRHKLGQIGVGTKRNYDRTTKLFFDRALQYGFHKITDLTPEFVDGYLLWRKESIVTKGGDGVGIASDVVVLCSLFDFAVEEGWITKTLLKMRPKIPPSGVIVPPFTEEEIEALDSVDKPVLESVVFAIFRYTGLRCGDVANLRWSAIDWKTNTLRTITSKRGKPVEIPMSADFVRIMDDFFQRRAEFALPHDTEDWVLPGMAPSKLYRMVKQWGEKAGVENPHPHRFRHYFACHWLGRGLSLFDVAKLLGDTHAVVDKHYGKWTNGQQERIRGIMGA